MGYLAEEVINACKLVTVACEILTSQQATKVRLEVEGIFASQGNSPLWSRLIAYDGIYSPDGWKAVETYTDSLPIFLFFEPHLDDSIVLLHDSSKLSQILGECSGFIFYVTRSSLDYLLCFNDHDALIGAGKAKEWIEQLKNKRS